MGVDGHAISLIIVGVLRNLVLFVQFEKREKHPQRSITFN